MKVYGKEIHHILAGPVLLALHVGGKDIFLNGGIAPSRPIQGYYWHGQVVFGDVTVLCKARTGDTTINRQLLNPGWWICKYEIGQPRIDLSKLTFSQVKAIAEIFGCDVENEEAKWLRSRIGPMFYRSPAFESVKEWAKAHPRLAAQGISGYSGEWGPIALGKRAFGDIFS